MVAPKDGKVWSTAGDMKWDNVKNAKSSDHGVDEEGAHDRPTEEVAFYYNMIRKAGTSSGSGYRPSLAPFELGGDPTLTIEQIVTSAIAGKASKKKKRERERRQSRQRLHKMLLIGFPPGPP